MSDHITRPSHVKYRHEAEGGLVYDHENYGYEDATLKTVDSTVIDVLKRIDENEGCTRASLEQEFGVKTVDTLLAAGILADE